MTLQEYQRLALRTESVRPFGRAVQISRLTHAALGIVTELGEWRDRRRGANEIEELGDLCWYLVLASDALGFRLDYGAGWHSGLPLVRDLDVSTAYPHAEKLADEVKRAWFYRRALNVLEASRAVRSLFVWVVANAEARGPVGYVFARNIAKLRKRFPDGFSGKRAINRDLAAELDALEGRL